MQIRSNSDSPQEARESLSKAESKYGFVPNILGVMANAPPLLKAYLTLTELFEATTLTPVERQVVILTISRENRCEYCVAAHTITASMQETPPEVVEALRKGQELGDDKLESLRRYTQEVVQSRGWPSDAAKERLFDAGYTESQALEVILGVGMKTLSNYTNHFADTPLDEAFASGKWETPES